jgi:S1-C subfamily serine protease
MRTSRSPTRSSAARPSSTPSSCTTGPVVAGSPAAKAGLAAGDTITKVDGKTITDPDDFISAINGKKPGDVVTMTVTTPSGKVKQVKVTLGNRPATAPTES